MSTGHLHLNGFESQPKIKTRYPDGYLVFMAEDEGFEPPQTESESGVLPLHKSSNFLDNLVSYVTGQKSFDYRKGS